MRDLVKRDWIADGDIDAAADAACRLAEKQSETRRIVEMAGDLEQARILAREVDRHHGCARIHDELGDEGMPGGIERHASQSFLTRRHAASRKDTDGMAFAQPLQGVRAPSM